MRAPVKLTHAERRARGEEFRRRYLAGEKPLALADEYGVHLTTAWYWIRGKNAQKSEPVTRPQCNSVFNLGAQA